MNNKYLKYILQNRAEIIAPRSEIDLWPSIQKHFSSRHPALPSPKGGLRNIKIKSSLLWKPVLLATLLIMSLVFATSSQVRARALELVKMIAGYQVDERSESPLKDYEEGTVQATEYTIPVMTMPEALVNPPFPFNLPYWVPEGYTLKENVAIANSKEWISMNWVNPNGGEIFMLVEKQQPQYNLPIGVGSSEEIEINGQQALLVKGGWANAYQWDPARAVVIYWEINGLYYRLGYSGNGPIADMNKAIAMLVQMAESVP
jgi:hypothetical protein